MAQLGVHVLKHMEDPCAFKMNKTKLYILMAFGAIFLAIGIYKFAITKNIEKSISYWYIGIGTWIAIIIFILLFPRYKEIASLLLGLIILHSGVLLIIIGSELNSPEIIGLITFIAGIIVALNSNFSEYIREHKKKVKRKKK
ncbi:MAG: hypothetical protein ACE5KT_02415 [Methanosarcinales archaeon]